MTDAPPPASTGDDHPGELLSALVDGELAPDERTGVDDHLASCERCRAELAEIEASRTALLSLPELEPPTDFIEAIVRRRHRLLVRGTLVGFAAAVLAAAFALTSDLVPAPVIQPELAGFEADHSTTAITAPETPTRSSSASFGDVAVDNEIAGFDLVALARDDDVVHAIYRREQRVVSVFRQDGRVDWESLPGDGRRVRVGAREAWQAADESTTVLDAGGSVLTIVGGDAALQVDLASEVSDPPRPSLWNRAHDAAQTVLGGFDLG